ncbi:MAG: glucosamine-6-phosphate deaminase [Bacteroidota bacterium]
MIPSISKSQGSIVFSQPGALEETRFEKVHNVVFKDSSLASIVVAHEISKLIRQKQNSSQNCILGLATGSSPIKVYEELVRMHRDEGLSFENVITFNLDEYYPMTKDNIQSYHYFMHEHLFNHIDIPTENVHIPDGMVPMEHLNDYCSKYDTLIQEYGGLDFQLLGIGRTGHIGFNEPGSHYNSKTRTITLDHITRVDAAQAFLGIDNVPRKAITMGIGTIKKAKRIILLAWGTNKANIIKDTIEGKVSSDVPATYLQEHANTTFVLDKAASSELTRIKEPWVVGDCIWNEKLKSKAIIWLCEKLEKPVLKLTDKDYNNHGMADLLTQEGSAYDLNINMFNRLQHTITGWPGGKPNADDSKRPERAFPEKKRVIVFSPHPDDDVISMGGTLERLVEQGHEVHVAYQTTGNIAVSKEEALKYAEVCRALYQKWIPDPPEPLVMKLFEQHDSEVDSEAVLDLKRLIREKEAIGATRFLGISDQNVHFLKMPFYGTGTSKKRKLSKSDIDLLYNLIKTIKPHQIFAAGDLVDPHGTHKTCLDALLLAFKKLNGEEFMKKCWVWLYSGAWDEWKIYDIDMVVPMSPDQVVKKRNAIFYHQSQLNRVMFRGDDSREFWVRAEERNRNTAKKYHQLGMAEYEALEAFKRMRLE